MILLSLGVGIFSLEIKTQSGAEFDEQVQASVVVSAPNDLQELRDASSVQLDQWTNLSRFDGRDYGYITPERNQGSLGICWAYAAVGAVEANILRDGIDAEENKDTLDLDDIVAAYSRFNRDGESDPLYLTANDTYSSENWRSSGDFADNALMAMTQGFSLVDQVSNQNWKDWAIKQRIAQSKYFVQGFKQIDHTRDAIKRAILEYGAVTMEYKSPDSAYDKYVCHTGIGSGHASLIIGWDDSISSSLFTPDTPSTNGAWIVKNSWGYGGDKGVNGTCCFYLSYEAYMTNNLFVVDMGMREDYQNIYYYDGRITENPTQYYADAYGAIYEAKLSTANEQEQLAAVSFGIRNTQATVDITVYKLDEVNLGNVNDEINKPDAGTVIGQKNQVYFEDDGFYTVDFDQPIILEPGEIFSIVISGKDSKGGRIYPYLAVDSFDSLNDMTYRKYGGEWTSFKGSKNTYPGNSAGSCVRLRAITNIVKTEDTFDSNLQYARMELASKFVYYEKDTAQTPELLVYFGNKILQENEDYEVVYTDNTDPGKATVTISGINNFYGEQSTTFEIASPAYPPGMISGQIEVYNDTTRLFQIPVPEGWKWGETQDITLVTGESPFGYQMKYIGEDADCYQHITYSVKIFKNNSARPAQIDISGSTVTISGKYTYNGSQITPSLRVVCKGHELKLGSDFTVQCQNNTEAGVATVTINGQGGYSGQIEKQFDIKKAKYPTERPKSVINVGKDVKKLSQVPLDCVGWSWQDYNTEITSDYFDAVAVYTGAGMSNYANTKMTVTIIRESETGQKNIFSISELRLDEEEFVYDGHEKTPDVIARDGQKILSKGTDFDVEYKNNTNAGQASVVVKGINDYMGAKTLSFTIKKANRQSFVVSQPNWTYGDESTPNPSIDISVDDSTVAYSYSTSRDGEFVPTKPKNAGTYWVKAEILESQNFNGAEAKAEFTIAQADSPDQVPQKTMTVSRKTKTLKEVKLASGWQWENPDTQLNAESIVANAVYDDRINYKNSSIQITINKEEPKEASLLSVTLEKDEFVYDGTFKTPKVVAKDDGVVLVLGEDYDVQYEDNKVAGQGKVTVKFKNDYKGERILNFTIAQAKQPNVNTTIKISKRVSTLADITLPDGFEWVDETTEITSDRFSAKAIYVGADSANFETTELTFEILFEKQSNRKLSYWWLLLLLIPMTAIAVVTSVFVVDFKRRKRRWLGTK